MIIWLHKLVYKKNNLMGRKNSKKKKEKQKGGHSGEKVLKGKLDVTRSGMGFVTVENMDVDVLIRPSDFNTALHGDIVRVALKSHKSNSKRMQGVVSEVLERKRNEFIGELQMNKGFAFFIPETDRPMPDVFIPLSGLNGAHDKDRVIVRIIDWENGGKRPVGEITSVLDMVNQNDAARLS